MTNFLCRVLRIWVAGIVLIGFAGFEIPEKVYAQNPDQQASPGLSPEDLNILRARILSNAVDFNQRVQVASSLTQFLEIGQHARNARRLCLDFYSSVASKLDEKSPVDLPPPNDTFLTLAKNIDEGKRHETVAKIEETLQGLGNQPPHPCLGLLALKADNMPLTYRVLYADLTQKRITPFSLYVMGILAARENRLIEADRFMQRAKGRLGSSPFERWLLIDLAKISIVNRKTDDAQSIIQQLLQQNPKDAQALSVLIYSNLENKKDLSRQELTQLIDLLYPDPYLIAETAKLAIQLMELDTAAKILEKFESQVEPNRDFYEVYSFVRKNQGKPEEAEKWLAKARQIRDSRVAVNNVSPLSDELKEAVSAREERRKEVESIQTDILSKVYICLLEEDHENALAILQNQTTSGYERFILAQIQRRAGLLRDAASTLESIRSEFHDFRPYQVLSLLADLYDQLGDVPHAQPAYKELHDRFPDSTQADVAQRVLSGTAKVGSESILSPIRVSTRMSRYPQYAAPFILTEILRHWGDPASFASFTTLLRVSPRRGMQFNEFLTVLASVTRHQVVPFVGVSAALIDCLKQDIPIVFCQGEMFESQRTTGLTLVIGADPDRNLFYAEGVTPFEPTLYTETELLEGLCIAVYPSTLEPKWSEETQKAIKWGKEFVKYHLEASHIRTNPDYDTQNFTDRRQSVIEEKDRASLPLKLAFARWMSGNKPNAMAKQYLDQLKDTCQESAYYWFQCAELDFRQKNAELADRELEEALKRSPESPRYDLARVRMLDQENQLDAAILAAEALRGQNPEDVTVSLQLLLLYEKSGDQAKKTDEENRLKNILHIENIKIDLDAEKEEK